jgi:hypothetical protein
MQLYDAELFDLWVDITQGRVERPGKVIEQDFGARYVMSDLQHARFLEQADNDPDLMEVYRDGDSVVFQITSQSE